MGKAADCDASLLYCGAELSPSYFALAPAACEHTWDWEGTAGDVSSTWAPANHVGDQMEFQVPVSNLTWHCLLWSWGVTQQTQDLFLLFPLSLLLCLPNKQIDLKEQHF